MYYNTSTSKKYQCSSEFGLYRNYDSDSEDCKGERKKIQFNFRYFVILVTTIIVLSSICLVIYNYVHIPQNNDSYKSKINDRKCIHHNDSRITENLSVMNNWELDQENNKPVAMELQDGLKPGDMLQRKFRVDQETPRPFIYEMRDPKPVGFHLPHLKNPLGINQLPKNKGNNIQEIIKYLSAQQDAEMSSEQKSSYVKHNGKRSRQKGGFYVISNKKDYSKRQNNYFQVTSDPFFPYKPQNPSDVNLLAVNNFRFAPPIPLEPPKIQPLDESYPKYESPYSKPEEDPYYHPPISDDYTLSNYNQFPRSKNPKQNSYTTSFTQNHNTLGRLRQNKIVPPWIQPWGVADMSKNVIPNIYQSPNVYNSNQRPMVLHLNIYPKNKRKHNYSKDSSTGESHFHQANCSKNDVNNDNKLDVIRNVSEFNQLMLQKMNNEYPSNVRDNPFNHNLFQIKDTFLEPDSPKLIPHYTEQNQPNPITKNQDVEVQKSIGFTLLNSNFSAPGLNNVKYYKNDFESGESGWHPLVIQDGKYFQINHKKDLQDWGEVKMQDPDFSSNSQEKLLNKNDASQPQNDEHETVKIQLNTQDPNYDLDDEEMSATSNDFAEPVTLPLPNDLFQKFFNTKPTPKYDSNDWGADDLQKTPNLINHKAYYRDNLSA